MNTAPFSGLMLIELFTIQCDEQVL